MLGRVEGEIRTQSIRIAATGEVAGNIGYETMAIDEGAAVNGQVSKVKPGADRADGIAAKVAAAGKP